MRTLLIMIVCLFTLSAYPQYIVKKMSDYPAKVGIPPLTDYCLMNDSGVTKRVTIAQICGACGSNEGFIPYIDTLENIATKHYADSLYTMVSMGATGPTGATGTDGRELKGPPTYVLVYGEDSATTTISDFKIDPTTSQLTITGASYQINTDEVGKITLQSDAFIGDHARIEIESDLTNPRISFRLDRSTGELYKYTLPIDTGSVGDYIKVISNDGAGNTTLGWGNIDGCKPLIITDTIKSCGDSIVLAAKNINIPSGSIYSTTNHEDQSQKLEWSNQIDITNYISVNSENIMLGVDGANIKLEAGGTGGGIELSNGDFSITTHDNNLIINPSSSGYVGIGTASPISKLHIVGEVNEASGSLLKIENTTTGNTLMEIVAGTNSTEEEWNSSFADGTYSTNLQYNARAITLTGGTSGNLLKFSDNGNALQVTGTTLFNITTGSLSIVGLPAYDDDAAAAAGGISTNSLYQTTGSGAAPLNVAGIVMIKQ